MDSYGDETQIDLQELFYRARREEFYGEMVVKWERGEPVMVQVNQKFKPKDFRQVVFHVFSTNGIK